MKLQHHNSSLENFHIECELRFTEFVELHFTVHSKEYDFKKSERFSNLPFKNWGFWEEDVIEIFIRRKGEKAYLEAQISPSSLGFQLIIEKPRELFYTPLFETVKTTSSFNGKKWQGTLTIPQGLIPGSGSEFEGGIFAILGNPREHYALNPNPEKSPDYHRPELFIPFVKMS